MRAMDYFEIALNFSQSDHGGDKRKLSQQCFLPESVVTTLTNLLVIEESILLLKTYHPNQSYQVGRCRADWCGKIHVAIDPSSILSSRPCWNDEQQYFHLEPIACAVGKHHKHPEGQSL